MVKIIVKMFVKMFVKIIVKILVKIIVKMFVKISILNGRFSGHLLTRSFPAAGRRTRVDDRAFAKCDEFRRQSHLDKGIQAFNSIGNRTLPANREGSRADDHSLPGSGGEPASCAQELTLLCFELVAHRQVTFPQGMNLSRR